MVRSFTFARDLASLPALARFGTFGMPVRSTTSALQTLPECFVIQSDACAAHRIRDHIAERLREGGYPERDVLDVLQALDEAMVNAIKHGNCCDSQKMLRISFCVDQDCFQICIEDEGQGFDPASIADPLSAECLEIPCGRGLLMMRHYMSEVSYLEPGNAVMMVKKRCGCE
jgi:serine/threonine-protein kinase RsbW